MILASTTTATLGATEIASIIYRASKIVGLRSSNPGEEIQRLEIVRGAATDDEAFGPTPDAEGLALAPVPLEGKVRHPGTPPGLPRCQDREAAPQP